MILTIAKFETFTRKPNLPTSCVYSNIYLTSSQTHGIIVLLALKSEITKPKTLMYVQYHNKTVPLTEICWNFCRSNLFFVLLINLYVLIQSCPNHPPITANERYHNNVITSWSILLFISSGSLALVTPDWNIVYINIQ